MEEKKEVKGVYVLIKNYVSNFGLTTYSVWTKNSDGTKYLVVKTITARGIKVNYIPLNELIEVSKLIK